MIEDNFFIPWANVDPSLRDGGIPGELAGQYVAPRLSDNKKTLNIDLLSVFVSVNQVATSISMHRESDVEGYVNRSILNEMLGGLNLILEKIVDVTKATNTNTFGWCHAIPPTVQYSLRPIRFPVRNQFVNEYTHYLIGLLVEVAELNRNALHSGLDPRSADLLIAPLYQIKSKIMKYYFDLEVSGELSRPELDLLMVGKNRPGPTVSIPDASADRPEAAAVIEAMSGFDVVQWAPSQQDWVVFSALQEARWLPERILQPEGARPTTEDVANEQLTNAGDGSPHISSTAQP